MDLNIRVLIIGYNRPDYIRDRLSEIEKIKDIDIHVSVDGSNSKIRKEFESILFDFSQRNRETKFTFQLHQVNLGLVRHVTKAITETLAGFDAVIVIEDDVSISEASIQSLKYGLSIMATNKQVASVGSFSPIAFPRLFREFNVYRYSRYFSCWGWATTGEIWKDYSHVLTSEYIDKMQKESRTWNQLSKKQKETWIGRFNRVQANPGYTWDTQFQFMSFAKDQVHILPVGSLSTNVGFGDARAVHTKGERPKWIKNGNKPTYRVQRISKSRFLMSIFHVIESNSVIGDSKSLSRLKRIVRH